MPHERRVVHAGQPPFRDRERLAVARACWYRLSRPGPRGRVRELLVVDVDAFDVDVLRARVVVLGRVARRLAGCWMRAGSRRSAAPETGCREAAAALQPRQPRPSASRRPSCRAAVEDDVDARKRLLEGRGRMRRVPRLAVRREAGVVRWRRCSSRPSAGCRPPCRTPRSRCSTRSGSRRRHRRRSPPGVITSFVFCGCRCRGGASESGRTPGGTRQGQAPGEALIPVEEGMIHQRSLPGLLSNRVGSPVMPSRGGTRPARRGWCSERPDAFVSSSEAETVRTTTKAASNRARRRSNADSPGAHASLLNGRCRRAPAPSCLVICGAVGRGPSDHPSGGGCARKPPRELPATLCSSACEDVAPLPVRELDRDVAAADVNADRDVLATPECADVVLGARGPRTRPANASGRRRRSASSSRITQSLAVPARRARRARASVSRRSVPVDRAAVVGVDQREERQLVALVDVGHAGRGEPQHELAERDRSPGLGDLLREGHEVGEEPLVLGRARARSA